MIYNVTYSFLVFTQELAFFNSFKGFIISLKVVNIIKEFYNIVKLFF